MTGQAVVLIRKPPSCQNEGLFNVANCGPPTYFKLLSTCELLETPDFRREWALGHDKATHFNTLI